MGRTHLPGYPTPTLMVREVDFDFDFVDLLSGKRYPFPSADVRATASSVTYLLLQPAKEHV